MIKKIRKRSIEDKDAEDFCVNGKELYMMTSIVNSPYDDPL